MGKATRWLKALFSAGGRRAGRRLDPGSSTEGKGKWDFAGSVRSVERKDMAGGGVSSYRGGGGAALPAEGGERVVAVAPPTAAAAESAAAKAAAEARLTGSGRPSSAGGQRRRREEHAAVKIQALFRGYLARRALKALKGLVKLQALVRGHIVRKQAAETLRCMHALVRVQARVRANRSIPEKCPTNVMISRLHHPGFPTPEKHEPSDRSAGFRTEKPRTLHRRNTSKVSNVVNADANVLHHTGLAWLDRWMEENCWGYEDPPTRTGGPPAAGDEKILEIDDGNQHHHHVNHRRRSNQHSSSGLVVPDRNCRSFTATTPDSPIAQHSVPSPSSADTHHPAGTPRSFTFAGDGARESPQFFPGASSHVGSARGGGGPFTPSKSEASQSQQSFASACSGHCPKNYMALTESSKAKARSHSAPRQRPEVAEKPACGVKRLSSVQGCGSSSGSKGSASSSLHQRYSGKAYPGSGRLDRLGMPVGW